MGGREKEEALVRRIVLVLVVAAVVAATMMGSAGPVFGSHGGSHGIDKASPDLFCGGFNNADGKTEGNVRIKLNDVIVSSACSGSEELPPGQKVREPA